MTPELRTAVERLMEAAEVGADMLNAEYHPGLAQDIYDAIAAVRKEMAAPQIPADHPAQAVPVSGPDWGAQCDHPSREPHQCDFGTRPMHP